MRPVTIRMTRRQKPLAPVLSSTPKCSCLANVHIMLLLRSSMTLKRVVASRPSSSTELGVLLCSTAWCRDLGVAQLATSTVCVLPSGHHRTLAEISCGRVAGPGSLPAWFLPGPSGGGSSNRGRGPGSRGGSHRRPPPRLSHRHVTCAQCITKQGEAGRSALGT